ncbi:hypothetical protein FOMPIDRAFT_1026206 [Fomitopsis schrenkii]|uniref:Uncharacterized protein n=1 Tax=Fomitopsis schrenkii TaxID=2126942 RepID=S8DP58_FOMSC|nr:hypothetical protein FOMPIDRAFT_1026206 [Fomitopsis schrenkii]
MPSWKARAYDISQQLQDNLKLDSLSNVERRAVVHTGAPEEGDFIMLEHVDSATRWSDTDVLTYKNLASCSLHDTARGLC